MSKQLVMVGAGIGGLSAAIALGLKGLETTLYERSSTHSVYGAGIQLGPNALKRLTAWGLMPEVMRVASVPKRVEVYEWTQSKPLASMNLGQDFLLRYGLPYLTLHRADLHELLLSKLQAVGQSELRMDSQLMYIEQDASEGVNLFLRQTSTQEPLPSVQTQALVACDGVFSAVRQHLWPERILKNTGHMAYRCMVPQHMLPHSLRTDRVQVWMGPGMHWVQYPVRGDEWLNVVVLIESGDLTLNDSGSHAQWQAARDPQHIQADFARALFRASPVLHDTFRALGNWGAWQLWDMDPLCGPHEMVQSRVALLGDAAHPMLPYLAQAGAMAIEDAQALSHSLSEVKESVELALARFASIRWRRNSRLQARARLQAKIYHANGILGWSRNLALQVLGERIMQMPWIYEG